MLRAYEAATCVAFVDGSAELFPVDAALGVGPTMGIDSWMRRFSSAAFMAMKPRIRICVPCSHV